MTKQKHILGEGQCMVHVQCTDGKSTIRIKNLSRGHGLPVGFVTLNPPDNPQDYDTAITSTSLEGWLVLQRAVNLGVAAAFELKVAEDMKS